MNGVAVVQRFDDVRLLAASFLLLPQSVIPIGDDAAAREVAVQLIAPIVTAH